MKAFSACVACLALIPLLAIGGCKKPAETSDQIAGTTFRKDGELTISGTDGQSKASFDIEIADTPDALRQGLMYRETMAPDQGMLFIMSDGTPQGFWMKDTYLPLDILFIDTDGVIFQIAENTVPFSEELIESTQVNTYTLELNAGTSQRMKLAAGDKIDWKRIK